MKHYFIIALAVLLFSTQTRAQPITDFVAFGDSLSDSGNLYAIANHPTSPPYFEGRFSDGPTFVEYLNESLGLSPLLPAVMGGKNYAWGGARAGFDVPISGGAIPGIQTQTLAYLQGNPTITPETLFSIYIGNNDVSDALEQGLSTQDAQLMFGNAVNQIIQSIMLLQANGGQQFLTPLVPDWSLTPRYLGDPKAKEFTDLFNLIYQQALGQLDQVDLTVFDTIAFFEQNQDEFLIKNVACLGQQCTNPDNYLFFDDIHPTTKAHLLFAQQVPITVPVPPTWLLMGLGLMFLTRRRC